MRDRLWWVVPLMRGVSAIGALVLIVMSGWNALSGRFDVATFELLCACTMMIPLSAERRQ